MGDKFPKEYVVQRLEARKASLKSRDAEGQKAWAEWKASKDPEAEDYYRRMKAQLERLSATDDAAPDVWQRIDRAHSKLRSLMQDAPQQPSSSWRSDRPEAVQSWLRNRDSWRFEVTKIDHGLAYLKEMPVTELNITMITKLKLTDAISFDLRVEQDKQGRLS